MLFSNNKKFFSNMAWFGKVSVWMYIMNEEGHILVKIYMPIQRWNQSKQHANLKYLVCENVKHDSKGHYEQILHAITALE